jgi:hypothetical protein
VVQSHHDRRLATEQPRALRLPGLHPSAVPACALQDAPRQRQHGKELTPISPYGPGNEVGDAFGHLRLTPELSKRLRRAAASRRLPVAELVRQVLEAGLP